MSNSSGITMSTAVGAYFRTLRERQGLSQEAVGKQINLSGKQVYNWERGASSPGSEALIALLNVIGGSLDHLRVLFRKESTVELGEELAYKWLSARDIAELDAIPHDQRGEALLILDEIERRDTETFQAAIRLLKALVGR